MLWANVSISTLSKGPGEHRRMFCWSAETARRSGSSRTARMRVSHQRLPGRGADETTSVTKPAVVSVVCNAPSDLRANTHAPDMPTEMEDVSPSSLCAVSTQAVSEKRAPLMVAASASCPDAALKCGLGVVVQPRSVTTLTSRSQEPLVAADTS